MEKRNFRMVLQLLNEAEVHADGSPSDLDRRFRRLERKKGSNHPALIQYNKVVRGAGDTVGVSSFPQMQGWDCYRTHKFCGFWIMMKWRLRKLGLVLMGTETGRPHFFV